MSDFALEIKTNGLVALKERLGQIATKDAQRMMRKALRAGGAVFEAAIEERAPERPDLPSGTALPPGALRRDVTIKAIPAGDPSKAMVAIGPGKYTNHAAHLVEFGHRLVRGGKSTLRPGQAPKGNGVTVGWVPAHPYTRPAFEGSGGEALSAVQASLTEDFARLDARGSK